MNYSKLSDDVLRKKIISSIKDINSANNILNRTNEEIINIENTANRDILISLCEELGNKLKNLKSEVKEYEKQIAIERKKEEDEEIEKRRLEKIAKT